MAPLPYHTPLLTHDVFHSVCHVWCSAPGAVKMPTACHTLPRTVAGASMPHTAPLLYVRAVPCCAACNALANCAGLPAVTGLCCALLQRGVLCCAVLGPVTDVGTSNMGHSRRSRPGLPWPVATHIVWAIGRDRGGVCESVCVCQMAKASTEASTKQVQC